MADKKTKTVKVKVDGKIHDGEGGYFKKGDTFDPKGCDVEALKARGLVE